MLNNGKSESPDQIFLALKEKLFATLKTHPALHERLRHFKCEFNSPEDARQLAELMRCGADKLKIEVGAVPHAIGPGLAYMYDLVLEAIRQNPEQLHSKIFNERALRTGIALFDIAALNVGRFTVTALEQALVDEHFASRLRQRAGELAGTLGQGIARDNNQPPFCEYCTIIIDDNRPGGEHSHYCGTKDECDNVSGSLLLLLLLLLAFGLLKWLLD